MRWSAPLIRRVVPCGWMAALLVGAVAPAGTLQVIEFVEAPEVPTDPGLVEWPVTVSLPKFDLSLGTLTGVRFTFTSTVGADVGFENRQEGASNTLDYSLPFTAQFLVPSEIVPTEQAFTLTGTSGELGSYDGITDFGGSSGITVSLGPTGAVTHLDVAGGDFGLYSRSGAPETFDITLYMGRGSTDVTGDGAKIFSYAEVVAGQARVDVTYLYFDGEEVPEAGGWVAAAGLSGAVLGWRWRRRERRKRAAVV